MIQQGILPHLGIPCPIRGVMPRPERSQSGLETIHVPLIIPVELESVLVPVLLPLMHLSLLVARQYIRPLDPSEVLRQYPSNIEDIFRSAGLPGQISNNRIGLPA